MAVAMMVDNPHGSQELYEAIRAHLGLEKPAGGIFHVAGPSPNGGWRVIEVWESEEARRGSLPSACGRPSRRSARRRRLRQSSGPCTTTWRSSGVDEEAAMITDLGELSGRMKRASASLFALIAVTA